MADAEQDDLLDVDHNQLFRALQTKHHKVWQQAQENCWMVCIPKPSIANSIKLTKDVVQRHVLRPSPIFKGQFITLGAKPIKLEFQDNQAQLRPLDGKTPPIRIIHEEAFYNENFEPFKVYCIDSAIGSVQFLKTKDPSETQVFQLKPLNTGREYVAWLEANVDAAKLEQCLRLVRAFNLEYLTAKGYVHYVQDKVTSLWRDVLMKVQGSHRRRAAARSTTDVAHFWEEAAECFVLVNSHKKLRVVYEREWDAHARVLHTAAQRYVQSPEQLKVPSSFAPLDLTRAMDAVARMPERPSRLDKDAALQEVLDLISASAELHNVTTGARLVLTSDDLIPLLSKCILLSGQRHLFSELSYLKDLRLADTNASSQAHFNLVTLEAALMNAVQSYGLTLPAHVRDNAEEDQKAGVTTAAQVAGDAGLGADGEDLLHSGQTGTAVGTRGLRAQPATRTSGEAEQKQPAPQGKEASQRRAHKANADSAEGEDGDQDSREIVLPEVKSRVRTTDGQAPRVGGLLSRLSQFNM